MNKIVLITGASSGIGMSVARRLLAAGAVVYAAARRVDMMEPLRESGAKILKLDLTDGASVKSAVDTIIGEQGRIDILVNNAGYGYFGAIETVSLEEARRQFDVNVFGLAQLCRLVLPHMRENGSGRIINVASMAGHFCEPRGGWYHATKYAVVALSDCMRMEVKPFGIKVITIEPGAINTPWCDIAMDNMLKSSEGTPYAPGAAKQSKLFRWAYAHFATSPEVVAKRIVRGALSRHPHIRYRCGFGSHAFNFFHDILPDRWFDSLMNRFFNQEERG